jgi:hypothetical protein
MMLGAGETLPPLFNTISLRDDRQSPEILASTRARYPISGHLRGGPIRDRGLIWARPRGFLSQSPTLQQSPPEGVGAVARGQTMVGAIEGLGEIRLRVV